MTAEAVIAVALLLSPAPAEETASNPTLAAWGEALHPSLLALSIDAEILDPREKGFVLAIDVAGDLAMLRRRACDLASAPQLEEAERLPDRKYVQDLMATNRCFRNHLSARLEIDLIYADDLRDAVVETDQLYDVWDTVRDARCEYYYVTVRRQALQLLRELIGPEAYYSGQLPPHVPVRHLSSR